ncbi:MAG: sugar transferase [Phycisphaerae bacterium]|nr:sugar transferase [Saprospiraceae bacterium]
MYLLIKRLFDILAATIALILLTPLFIIIIIALRLTGEGEVFYRQSRVGFRKQNFQIWKFATMLKNSPNMGTGSLTLRNDPRVTSVGKFLRKSKINELPQLFNLLTGDMSLVGPRPQMKVDFEAFSITVQEVIYNVHPGITGIGSIIFRDEEHLLSVPERDPRQFYVEHIAPYKGKVEIWYQQHLSFWTDLRLVLLTAWAVLNPKSNLHFRVFRDLPGLPEELQTYKV